MGQKGALLIVKPLLLLAIALTLVVVVVVVIVGLALNTVITVPY